MAAKKRKHAKKKETIAERAKRLGVSPTKYKSYVHAKKQLARDMLS